MSHKFVLRTGRINSQQPDAVNTTIKSANTPEGKALAPDDWYMVTGAKSESISWAEYTAWYKGLIWRRYQEDPTPFVNLLKRNSATLTCYCMGTNHHCHRFLAVEALRYFAKLNGIEFDYIGDEIQPPG